MDDGKDIFNHFSFWRQLVSTENHELAIVLLTDPFDEVATKPCKPVLVSDHNCWDISWHDLSQKGKQRFSFEVEATSDVFKDFGLRVEVLEVADLSFEFFSLLVTANSGIDSGNSVVSGSKNAVNVVASLVGGGSDCWYFVGKFPVYKGFFWDLQDFASFSWCDIFSYCW